MFVCMHVCRSEMINWGMISESVFSVCHISSLYDKVNR